MQLSLDMSLGEPDLFKEVSEYTTGKYNFLFETNQHKNMHCAYLILASPLFPGLLFSYVMLLLQ